MSRAQKKYYCIENNIPVRILYPFYANTYLLQYYANKKKILENHEVNTVEYKWNADDLNSKLKKQQDKDKISIFYAAYKILRNLDKNYGPKSGNIIRANFSFYKPRLIFIKFDIEIFNNYYNNEKKPIFTL